MSIQASYTLPMTGSWQPGFVARVSSADMESLQFLGLPVEEEFMESLIGVNAYCSGHNLKTQLQVRQVSTDTFDADFTSVDLLFTLVF